MKRGMESTWMMLVDSRLKTVNYLIIRREGSLQIVFTSRVHLYIRRLVHSCRNTHWSWYSGIVSLRIIKEMDAWFLISGRGRYLSIIARYPIIMKMDSVSRLKTFLSALIKTSLKPHKPIIKRESHHPHLPQCLHQHLLRINNRPPRTK